MKKRLLKKRVLDSLLNRAFIRSFGGGKDLFIFLGSFILWHKTRFWIKSDFEHLAVLKIEGEACYDWGKMIFYWDASDDLVSISEVPIKSLLTFRNKEVREKVKEILCKD